MESVISQLQMEALVFEQRQESKPTEYLTQLSLHPNQRTPVSIDWSMRCPGLYPAFKSPAGQQYPVVPSVSQESVIISDLILCMQGFSGKYITAIPAKRNEKQLFNVNDKIDKCWTHLANNILPVARYYVTLTKFVQEKHQFQYGKVNHSLAACLTKVRHDYLGVVARLEDQNRRGQLNLHKFYSQMQPYIFSFEMINNICETVEKQDARGGSTLSLLHEFTRKNTGKEEQLCQYLLECSAVPYMKQLEAWLYHGVITDPYNEFLIHDNQVVQSKDQLPDQYSDDYWGKRYTVTKDMVPVFLEKLTHIILCTGKYLNVLRQCGVHTKSTDAQDIVYSYSENKYREAIESAYQFASCSLLQHLMHDNDLIGHLKSVKRYLLSDQGDFFMKFMDMSEMELDKEIGDIVPSRLQTLVELALRTSSAAADPYKDNIKAELNQDDMMTLLLRIISVDAQPSKPHSTKVTKGWESLTFLYEVNWPISLILNKSSLMIYQLIFRHLFFCKYVERLLCKVWISNKGAKKLPLSLSNQYKAAWDLRQRMLLYVHNLEYYMTVEVIEPNWNVFLNELQAVKNVDQVLECHNTFQTTCLAKCMLINDHHFKVLNKFLCKCVEFCNFMSQCCEVKASPVHIPNRPDVQTVNFNLADSFSQKIANFNKSFTHHVSYLYKMGDTGLAKGISNDKLMDMLTRLDFNSYYKQSLDERKKSAGSSNSFISSEISG